MTATLPSIAKLKPNPHWARLPLFDRKGWKRMAFGQFAESVNERVEPADAAEEIYVGLDDLDSGSLHIRRWGKGSDVIGTKLRFRKGDIIFGRRRAYQRKVAVAEVDGICSAHAMVVRAKPAVVLPEFLPFLMMSDRFMKRAVEISVGSLSPTINWTTLKLEEFDLPPLDQQRRIAEILWATDEALKANTDLLESVSNRHDALISHLLREGTRRGATVDTPCGVIPKRWNVVPLGSLLELIREPVIVNPKKEYHEIGIRSHGKGIFHKEPTIGAKIGDKKVYVVEPNRLILMVIFAWEGALAITSEKERGRIASHRFPMFAARSPEVCLEFYLLYLLSRRGLQAIGNASPGGAGRNRTLGQKAMTQIPVPFPDGSEQREIVQQVLDSKGLIKAATEQVDNSKRLRTSLIETLVIK